MVESKTFPVQWRQGLSTHIDRVLVSSNSKTVAQEMCDAGENKNRPVKTMVALSGPELHAGGWEITF